MFETKICSDCGEEKPLTEFYKRRNRGFSWPCKSCENKASRQHYEAKRRDVRPEYHREWRLQRYFGITKEIYDDLLARQNFKCYICELPYDHFKRSLAVDHNHDTGEIRGLLCGPCNQKIISRINDPEIFDRAAAYLRQGTGLYVPKEFIKGKRKVRRKRRKKI